jgi:hypothetical protein
MHAPSGIRTRNPTNQAAKTYVLERATIGTGARRSIWENK